MGDNGAITSNLTGATTCNGSYWQGANISTKDFTSNLVWDEGQLQYNTNWDYGVTLNEDAIKEIVEKIIKQKETAKITPDEGPEIPKWTGFLKI